MAKDYYKILGVKKSAEIGDIKKAYRRLARKFHPDVNPGDKVSEEKFKEISEAYQVLSDPEKRTQYDQYGSDFPFMSQGSSQRHADPFAGFDFSQFGQNTGTGPQGEAFKDFFEDVLGFSTKTTTNPQQGEDTHYSIEISFQDAFHGMTADLTIQGFESCQSCSGTGHVRKSGSTTCPECQGRGQILIAKGPFHFEKVCHKCQGKGRIDTSVCHSCHGKGAVPKSSSISVKIPPGVDTGSRVRVPGKGAPGKNGAPPGDLFITVKVGPHPYFVRNGKNITLELPISISESVLGARIMIPTLDGQIKMTIPPSCNSNRIFRVQGKGFPDLKEGLPGDLMVKVYIVVPPHIKEQAKELIREFDRQNPFNPREGKFN